MGCCNGQGIWGRWLIGKERGRRDDTGAQREGDSVREEGKQKKRREAGG